MDHRILVIDDDQTMRELLQAELSRRHLQVVTEASCEQALERLRAEDFSVVLADINMGAMSGVDLCREAVALREDTPVVLMTAFASIEHAVAAIRAGAYDFVTKPFEMDALALTLDRALKHRELRDEVKRLRREVSSHSLSEEIRGESAAMKKMYDVVARVAETESTVLVTGESGTGKELVAKALHAKSSRASGPFVAINCAAMPESLLESELFGHVKGAFTDARGPRAGLFVKATGGTLFLDEIGEMPLGMQPKLLRALQERTVRPVGSDTEVPFDTRIIAASNRDLEAEVAARRFREDLFYRINVVHVPVPPLRERGNDILILAQHFLVASQPEKPPRVVGLTSAAADRLTSYAWPGNVRELQNSMERAVALSRFDHVGVDDLPERVRDTKASRLTLEVEDPAHLLSMDQVEQRYVRHVLDKVHGNKALAARVLGMDRRTLYRKLERWGDATHAESNGATSVVRTGAAIAAFAIATLVAPHALADDTIARPGDHHGVGYPSVSFGVSFM
jgi:two-component system response regulator HydG